MGKKGWKGEKKCSLCGKLENTDHILFDYVMAEFVWSCVKEALGWDRTPRSMDDFVGGWLPDGKNSYNLGIYYFACVAWSLWRERNKRAIDFLFFIFIFLFFGKEPSNVLNNIFTNMKK